MNTMDVVTQKLVNIRGTLEYVNALGLLYYYTNNKYILPIQFVSLTVKTSLGPLRYELKHFLKFSFYH